ncbi:MAG TPA: polyhydroxyalkanoate synthesis repressor PhaR [Acetobacteraceae bacterium]|nr:polyhydroxyalkanoate synthesis repressor PhaR [Acetobacteraceae bacterium]
MSETPANEVPAADTAREPPVVVKKYANRRLYNTESSSYITLDTLAEMVRGGRDFVVYDAKSGEDITRGVLTQIIVEEENKGRALLPTSFLRQLIAFYGDSMQNLVPRYLEQAMASFARQQQEIRKAMQQTMGSLFPFNVEEMGRQMERAMTLFSPFYRPPGTMPGTMPGMPGTESGPPGAADQAEDEIGALRAEIASLRQQLAEARAPRAKPAAPAVKSREGEPTEH